ncbi:MAG: SPOR domain-containing protein [Magnetococcales bacterium]|nr:SPOR domain-containing protein [Magnetococcales bacterium]
MGKTHFLNHLKGVLPDNRDMVQLPDPTLPSDIFLQLLMTAVKGSDQESSGLPQADVTHKQLLDALEERAATGRRLLVAVDQAHMLTDENATLLSLLIPFSAKDIRPVQLLLVGRPELLGCLESEPFAIIQKEIIGSSEITPLTRSEVLDFIHYTIQKQVGRRIRVSWFAWVDIYSISQGNPLRIEQILNQTLALIKLKPRWIITRSLVKKAQQKEQDFPTRRSPINGKMAAVMVAMAAVGISLFSWLFDSDSKPKTLSKIDISSPATPSIKQEADQPSLFSSKEQREDSLLEPERVAPREVVPPTSKTFLQPLRTQEQRVLKTVASPPPAKPRPQRVIVKYDPPPRISTTQTVKRVLHSTPSLPKRKIKSNASSSLSGIEPRRKGSFIIPTSQAKPRRVDHTPTPMPLRVGSKVERALEQVVAKVQQQEPNEILSELSLSSRSPLPLTTEETLKAAGQIYVVQIGSFLNRDNAERLMLELSNEGMEPYVHLFEKGAKRWFSVRLNYRNLEPASKMAETLSRTKNIPTRVIELFYE